MSMEIRDMSTIGFIDNSSNNIKLFESQSVNDRLEKINEQLKEMPSILDKNTLQKLKDGEYDITLKEYSDMSTYRTTMTALYGNSSASKLPSMLNNLFPSKESEINSAKDFINKMEENGIDQKSAFKLYTAMKSYSVINTLGNYSKYNYVNARV